jgi:hypothetical protein
MQVQAYQSPLGIGHVPHDLADGLRKLSDQGGESNNLIRNGELRVLQQVNHFDLVPAWQMLLANPF